MSTLLEQASLVMIPSGYKEDVVYSQIPTNGNGDLTFTRASNGTRVNSAGLVEVCPWNLFGNSEDAPSGWGNVYNIASVTANSTTAPNGTNTGNLIVENSVNSTHWFEQSFTAINGMPYTLSVYFKAKERTQCALFGFADNGVFATQLVIFDLSNGTVVSQSGTQTNSITDAGDGWYRCSITLTSGASATGYFAYGLANGGSNSYQGNGTSGLYMWGRQLNTGTLKPYFPTTDRLNVPRLTYQNGGGGCPSLLLEKQSTNLFAYSEQFDNAFWVKQNSSVTANATTSPDGTQNADKFIASNANVFHAMYGLNSVLTGSYTISVYAKKSEYDFIVLHDQFSSTFNAVFNLNTGAVVSGSGASIQSIGNGWYRCIVTFNGGGNTVIASLSPSPTSSAGTNYQGDGTSGIFIWGAQAEASSYPTSYIPTTSSSATRVADACYKTGISSLIGQTEGVLFADFNFAKRGTTANDSWLIESVVNDSDVGILIYAPNENTIYCYINNGLASGFQLYGSVNLTQRFKVAIAYKSGDYALIANGAVLATNSTSYAVPTTMNQIGFGKWVGISNEQVQSLNQSVIFKTRLSNAELIALTTI